MNRNGLELESPDTIFDGDRDLADEIGILIATYTGWAGLEDYCRDGGCVHDVEADIKLDQYDEQSAEITGSIEVRFEERYHRGCRDMTWSNYFKGQGTLIVDTATGVVKVEISAKQVPTDEEIEAEAEMDGRLADMAPEEGEIDPPLPF